MSKYNTLDVWNKCFGKQEDVVDYSGRLMKKSACGNPNSKFHPTLDHIRPLSKGGSDVLENIIICHRDTNAEKANHFPHYMHPNILTSVVIYLFFWKLHVVLFHLLLQINSHMRFVMHY